MGPQRNQQDRSSSPICSHILFLSCAPIFLLEDMGWKARERQGCTGSIIGPCHCQLRSLQGNLQTWIAAFHARIPIRQELRVLEKLRKILAHLTETCFLYLVACYD